MDASKLMSLMTDKKAALARRDKTVKPKDGKNRIVLLQGWAKGEEHVWFHDFGQHFIKDAAGAIQAVYICVDSTFGTPCAVCQALADGIRNAPNDAVIEALGEAKGSKRVLINALVLDSDKPNEPQIYELPPTAFGQIVSLVEEWGVEAFKREIVIERSGKGLGTKYTAQISPKEFEVNSSIIAKINDLSEYVKQESTESQNRALNSIGSLTGRLPNLTAATSAGALTSKPSEGSAVDQLEAASATVSASESVAANLASSELDDLLNDMP